MIIPFADYWSPREAIYKAGGIEPEVIKMVKKECELLYGHMLVNVLTRVNEVQHETATKLMTEMYEVLPKP